MAPALNLSGDLCLKSVKSKLTQTTLLNARDGMGGNGQTPRLRKARARLPRGALALSSFLTAKWSAMAQRVA
jgi:hypothetical protein